MDKLGDLVDVAELGIQILLSEHFGTDLALFCWCEKRTGVDLFDTYKTWLFERKKTVVYKFKIEQCSYILKILPDSVDRGMSLMRFLLSLVLGWRLLGRKTGLLLLALDYLLVLFGHNGVELFVGHFVVGNVLDQLLWLDVVRAVSDKKQGGVEVQADQLVLDNAEYGQRNFVEDHLSLVNEQIPDLSIVRGNIGLVDELSWD